MSRKFFKSGWRKDAASITRRRTIMPRLTLVRRVALLLALCAYATLWAGGVLSQWLAGGGASQQNRLATLFLLLAGTIVLLSTRTWLDVLLLACVALYGFTVEAVGVRFHLPFGAYTYTDALSPKLSGVPVVMALAWMTLVAYVRQMLQRHSFNVWIEATAAALWMTAIDLTIDPLAAHQLGYWRWANAGLYYGIPATNFAGWFASSLLVFCVLRKRLEPNPVARYVGLSIILFFTLIALAHKLYLAALVGGALCLTHFLLLKPRRT